MVAELFGMLQVGSPVRYVWYVTGGKSCGSSCQTSDGGLRSCFGGC